MSDSLFTAQPSSRLDADIGNYLISNPSGDFSGVLTEDDRWEVFYHLSDLPAGLLSWYPFRTASSLLQIGGGFGTLTGMLCDRCESVTVLEHDAFRAECIKKRWHAKSSLKVLSGSLSELPAGRFDYVVIVADDGFLEPVFDTNGYASLLNRAKKLLANDGKLLFAVPNRMGIKYLCGAPDASTGIPFDGLNNYPTGASVPSLSRPELLDVIKQAGFSKSKLYYPFPDHLLPQIIYTDEYQPGKELNERLRPYQVKQNSLVMDEKSLYEPLTANGMILYFCNAFLAECGDGDLSPVIYAAVSAERHREECASTVILDNGTVEKRSFYKEGVKGLTRLNNNLNELKTRGIPVISCNLEENRLLMPRITAPTLAEYLKDLAHHDPADLVECMDKLYDYILKSSEHVTPEKNALRNLKPDADWGPILRKAYLEMIPVNCFYNNGDFLFFDQEFVKDNYPAKYVMFRAVNDVYMFAPQTERYMPRSEMQARYGLVDLWPCFINEEEGFQDWLRQREMYRHFYKWVSNDKKNISRNGRLLLMDNKPEHILVRSTDRMFAAVEGAKGKTIVLFGAGKMTEYYLNKYGAKYPPAFIVDNDESKWNTEKYGFAVKSPLAIKELTPGQYRIIICSGAYQAIAGQLVQMGIHDFRIYLRSFDEFLEGIEINRNTNDKYNIGYVTGVFDLFHIGHLNILRRSKERCEYLIAGVLTDEICIKEKGKKPFIPFEERMEIVRHIDYVNRVVPVDDLNTDKLEAWKQLRYDCFFSGSDHEWYWLENQLKSVGSNVETFPYTESTNSTELRELIKRSLEK